MDWKGEVELREAWETAQERERKRLSEEIAKTEAKIHDEQEKARAHALQRASANEAPYGDLVAKDNALAKAIEQEKRRELDVAQRSSQAQASQLLGMDLAYAGVDRTVALIGRVDYHGGIIIDEFRGLSKEEIDLLSRRVEEAERMIAAQVARGLQAQRSGPGKGPKQGPTVIITPVEPGSSPGEFIEPPTPRVPPLPAKATASALKPTRLQPDFTGWADEWDLLPDADE